MTDGSFVHRIVDWTGTEPNIDGISGADAIFAIGTDISGLKLKERKLFWPFYGYSRGDETASEPPDYAWKGN